MRYTKQRDEYGCGPLAIINALRTLGADISLSRDGRLIYNLCNATPPRQADKQGFGTSPHDLEVALRTVGKLCFGPNLRIIHKMYPSLSEVYAWLEQKRGPIILDYIYIRHPRSRNSGHFTTLVGLRGSQVLLANAIYRDNLDVAALRGFTRASMRRILRQYPSQGYPQAWFLRLKDGR